MHVLSCSIHRLTFLVHQYLFMLDYSNIKNILIILNSHYILCGCSFIIVNIHDGVTIIKRFNYWDSLYLNQCFIYFDMLAILWIILHDFLLEVRAKSVINRCINIIYWVIGNIIWMSLFHLDNGFVNLVARHHFGTGESYIL